MLLIKKGEENNLVVTASQFKTGDTPVFYLFSFQHIITKEIVRFYSPLVVNNNRYDEFVITEVGESGIPVDTDNGIVSFTNPGQYYYSIYEMPIKSLNPGSARRKLEEGKAVVLDEENTIYYTPYVSDNENNSNIVYYS